MDNQRSFEICQIQKAYHVSWLSFNLLNLHFLISGLMLRNPNVGFLRQLLQYEYAGWTSPRQSSDSGITSSTTQLAKLALKNQMALNKGSLPFQISIVSLYLYRQMFP